MAFNDELRGELLAEVQTASTTRLQIAVDSVGRLNFYVRIFAPEHRRWITRLDRGGTEQLQRVLTDALARLPSESVRSVESDRELEPAVTDENPTEPIRYGAPKGKWATTQVGVPLTTTPFGPNRQLAVTMTHSRGAQAHAYLRVRRREADGDQWFDRWAFTMDAAELRALRGALAAVSKRLERLERHQASLEDEQGGQMRRPKPAHRPAAVTTLMAHQPGIPSEGKRTAP